MTWLYMFVYVHVLTYGACEKGRKVMWGGWEVVVFPYQDL